MFSYDRPFQNSSEHVCKPFRSSLPLDKKGHTRCIRTKKGNASLVPPRLAASSDTAVLHIHVIVRRIWILPMVSNTCSTLFEPESSRSATTTHRCKIRLGTLRALLSTLGGENNTPGSTKGAVLQTRKNTGENPFLGSRLLLFYLLPVISYFFCAPLALDPTT